MDKYIASCSFGKDSLAAIITRINHGEKIDLALYCRIMFDANISAEFPEHEEWIFSTAIPTLKKEYGVDTEIVQSRKTYVDLFYKKRKTGKYMGNIQGFANRNAPWCNSQLKVAPLNKWSKKQGKYISIIGMAADETERIKKSPNKIYPLADYGITEAEAFEICKENNLLSPAYDKGRQRLGCWFCHNQRIAYLKQLRAYYPEYWAKLLKMDVESIHTLKDNWTLAQLDERFANEDAQITLTGF